MDRFLKFFLLAATLAASTLTASSQTLVDRLPAGTLHLLDAKQRQAMVQRYKLGQHPVRIQNIAGGETVLDSLSDTYLHIRPTASDEITVQRYDDRMVMIHTVYTPEPDSRLTFLDTLGNEQKTEIKVSARDFYVKNDTLKEAEYLKYALPFVPYWQQNGDTLKVSWNVRAYLTHEDWARIALSHRSDPIVYLRENRKFKKTKIPKI